MPVSLNNTQIVFNDATTQTTSGVTAVNVSTGISSSGGKTPTLTNTGVTSLTGAGTVSLSGSTGAITITGTGGAGTVTSVATGNGLQGGTITSTGTLSVACPTFNTVGSYAFVAWLKGPGQAPTSGTNYSAGASNTQLSSFSFRADTNGLGNLNPTNNLSGTWKWLGGNPPANPYGDFQAGIACRVS
jgi:hypothetical protein